MCQEQRQGKQPLTPLHPRPDSSLVSTTLPGPPWPDKLWVICIKQRSGRAKWTQLARPCRPFPNGGFETLPMRIMYEKRLSRPILCARGDNVTKRPEVLMYLGFGVVCSVLRELDCPGSFRTCLDIRLFFLLFRIPQDCHHIIVLFT